MSAIREKSCLEHSVYNRLGKFIVIFNVIVFGYLYMVTEFLSLCHAITKKNVRLAWIAFVIVGIAILVRILPSIKDLLLIVWSEIKGLHLGIVLVLVIISFAMAMIIVPCNSDSMAYHLPRIMQWIQNQSVSYYFTCIPRQLYSQPFAEYAILNLFLLRGNDHWSNLVQWYSYFLVAQLVFLILEKLNVDKKIALIGALIALTAPIVVAESVTTQNDLFAGIWPLMYLYIGVDFVEKKEIRLNAENILLLFSMGIIAGLGFLSKAQGAIPIAIISIWILTTRLIFKDKIMTVIAEVLIIVCVAVMLACPYFVRNYSYTGSILASNYFNGLSIGTFDPRGIILNIYKNWCMGAKTYSNYAINQLLYGFGLLLATIFRFPLEDARITFPVNMFNNWDAQFSNPASYHMDGAAAPIINWLFIICIIVAVLKRERLVDKKAVRRVLLISIALVFAYVKWQPWVTRLMLPSYLLMVIYCVLVMESFTNNFHVAYFMNRILPCLLVFTVIPAIYNNGTYFVRSLVEKDRFANYFETKDKYWEYSDIVCYVGGLEAECIGLILPTSTDEYQLWTALKKKNNRIIHVDVSGENVTEYPQCIIKIEKGENELGDVMTINGRGYICTHLALDEAEYSIWEIVTND